MYQQMQRLNTQRHLHAIRTSFVSTMPIMIIGAYATVINNLPIPAYQDLMEQLFGTGWKNFGALAFNVTTQLAALMVVVLICSNLAQWYNARRHTSVHSGICGMVGLACYMAMSLPLEAADSIAFTAAGVTGLFVAMVVGVLSGELFIHICGTKRVSRMLSDDPDVTAPQAFASVLPGIIIVFGFVAVRMLLAVLVTPESLIELVNELLRRPYESSGESVGTAILYNISSHAMWLFGVHGNNVLDSVAKGVFATAAVGEAPKLITKTFFDAFIYMGGSGTTLALLIALFIFGRRKGYRTLFRYALPNAIFNINEPLIFGIPIVLNPVYAIPFVLTPCVMFFTSYLAMSIGLVPVITTDVSWATPVFVSGYITTGSIAGVLLQMVNLAIAVGIYAPFVRLSEHLSDMRYSAAYKDLVRYVTTEYTVGSRELLSREDEIGAVARNLGNQIELAMANGDMFMYYQPIVEPETLHMHSVEALLRWRHPMHGMINPMVTIAIAEELGLIDKLGIWIMNQSMQQRATWTAQGLPEFHVSVNVSTEQLNDRDFHKQVLQILNRLELTTNALQIEITETMALVENDATQVNLLGLHEAGVSIAMDDFGVGHSSLLYLRAMPIDAMKIDGSLSREVLKNPANLNIIATIHDLCKLMKVETVIEYVEDEQQLKRLMQVGDFLIQGYLFSPPIPGEELPDFLKSLARQASALPNAARPATAQPR